MKFDITEEQAEALESCTKVQNAANTTLQVALNNHSELTIKNQETSDEIWNEITEEHGLDMTGHDWAYTRLNGVACVISQSQQGETNGQD